MLNDLAKAMKALDGKKKLGRRVCPSCILARVSPNGYIKLSLDVLRVLWRVHQWQVALSFLFPENPPAHGHGATGEAASAAGSEQGDQAMAHQEEGSKSPLERPGEDEDRSRSPRLRVPEPDPNNPADLMASCIRVGS